ncbi:MAG: hypothetical protein ACRDGT_03260 [Candidatus Limnocylindria bacterium]
MKLISAIVLLAVFACGPEAVDVPLTTAPAVTATGECRPTIARMTPPQSFFDFVVGGSSKPDLTRDQLLRRGNFYGNAALWVLLPENGEVRTGGDKFLAWRVKTGVISYVALRVDAQAPEVRQTLDARSGYGDSGFQPGGVDLPTAGCWEVTYALDGANDLRFVLKAR